MNELELYRLKDSVFVEKDNGTKVNYFIFDEYEIHQGEGVKRYGNPCGKLSSYN